MNTDQWVNSGEALLEQRNYLEAELAFNRASSLDPSNSEVWYKLGNTRFWQGKYGEAELAYLECVRFDPLNLKAWYNLGVSLGEQHRWADAENIYLKAADLVPSATETWHSDIWTNLGAALNAQERYGQAKSVLEKAISINNASVEGWYNLGNNQLRQGDWAKAGEAYETAIGVSATFQKAWKGLAITQHERGDYHAAEQTYLEALRLDPVDKQSWFNLSVAQLNLAKLDEAEESCLSSIAIEPQEADNWCNLGLIKSRTGRPNEAESAYRKALVIDPQDATAWVNLGVSLRNQDRSSEAEYAYQRAVVFSSSDANAWRNLGNTLLDLDKFSEAENAARRVISLKPNNFLQHRAWSTLATAKANQSKNPTEVIYAYRRMARAIESFRLEESKWETRLEEFQTPAKALQHAAHYALKTDPRFSEQSLRFAIQSKARTLGELLNHEPGQIRNFLSSRERWIFDDLEQARESLEIARHEWNSVPQLQYPSVSGQTSKRLQPFRSPEQEQEWRQKRDSLGLKYDNFFHQLAVDHPELEPFMLGPRPQNFRFNLAKLKSRLKQEEAVLELLLVDDKTLLSFLVTKEGLVNASCCDGDDRLGNNHSTTLNQWLEEVTATLITGQHERADQIGNTLTDERLNRWGAILYGHLKSSLTNTKRLWISPHSFLTQLPFNAIPFPDGIEREVAIIPSAASLTRPSPKGPRPKPRFTLGVVAADALEQAPLNLQSEEVRRLRGTVKSAKRRWELAGSRVGEEPTLANIQDRAGLTRCLVLSCHGDGPNEDWGTLALGTSGSPELVTGRQLVDSLLLGGRLRNMEVDLVITSACLTGQVDLERAEEWLGLPLALQSVWKTKAMLLTLWEVEELPAMIWVVELVKALTQGLSAGQAQKIAQEKVKTVTKGEIEAVWLAEAQRRLPEERWRKVDNQWRETSRSTSQYPFSEPVHWAPFILVGDPKITVSPKR